MSGPVEWLGDGTPRRRPAGDILRPRRLEQARAVFLDGCELPRAWAGRGQWRILETGFGLGLNFLAAWQAWRDDEERPGLLHFVAIEPSPVTPDDIVRGAAACPALEPLAGELSNAWWGLLPGVHRLAFEEGRVLLTLHVGDVRDVLRREPFTADSVFLGDPSPGAGPWDADALQAMARHCRRGTSVATWPVADSVRQALAAQGFAMRNGESGTAGCEGLRGVFDPRWEPRRAPAEPPSPTDAIVIGAGLAGAAAASRLALRGWRVQVLDAGAQPASGASGLPVGLLAPHRTPDDNLLSRLTRAGVRTTLAEARARLATADWKMTGVLEHELERKAAGARGPRIEPGATDASHARVKRAAGSDALCHAGLGPTSTSDEAWRDWHRAPDSPMFEAADLPPDTAATWHPHAAWLRPAALVKAWLATPGIACTMNVRATAVVRTGDGWQVEDADGAVLAAAPLVIVAAALGSAALAPALALHAVRGQVSFGSTRAGTPRFAVNGHGHFIPVPDARGGTAWFSGSTYGRGEADGAPRAADAAANRERLRTLLPGIAARLAPAEGEWAGVRCVSRDRRPLVGDIEPGLWVSCAMGSRGLTFAALCADVLAATLHGEPLPVEARLAKALDAARQAPRVTR